MTKSAINSILSKLSDYKDYICVVDDNNRVYRTKSEADCGYFDDSCEAFINISKNDNPIRNTMNQGNFMIDFVDYDHITRIYAILPDKDTMIAVNNLSFDSDALKHVLHKTKASFTPAGFSYNFDKDGEPKQTEAPLPNFEPGVPIKTPDVHPVETEVVE